MAKKRNKAYFNELEYNGKTYLYTYEKLRDDTDSLDYYDEGFNMDEEESEFLIEIYDEHEKFLKEIDIELDSILEVTDKDVISIIKKYNL